MKYNKANAEVVVFDNSDVLMDKSHNCGHQTSGNSCTNNQIQKFDQCFELNHQACSNKGNVENLDDPAYLE